jgi:magnesium transporter
MSRFSRKHKNRKGVTPGSLVFVGKRKVDIPKITLIDYEDTKLTEKPVTEFSSLKALKNTSTVSWINLYGIHEPELLQKFGDIFDIPPLFIESILNTEQRPRFEEGEKNLGFILKMITPDKSGMSLEAEQISIILNENYVLSFQEHSTNTFEPVRFRIRNSIGKVRSSGTDYLVYIMLDTIIDNYLSVIAELGDKIEELGKSIIARPNDKFASEIYQFKIEISFLRKNIRPVKEMVLLWLKSDTDIVNRKTKPFLRDLVNLATQAEENIEIYNDLLIDGMNTHNANINLRANEIMKVLTIFASIFIPLTFLAGVYGMNFKYIPEYSLRYGYPLFWGVAIICSAILILFFKRRKWL